MTAIDATSDEEVPPNANLSAAIATRPRSRAAALLMPQADPPKSLGTASSTTVVSGVTHAVTPIATLTTVLSMNPRLEPRMDVGSTQRGSRPRGPNR